LIAVKKFDSLNLRHSPLPIFFRPIQGLDSFWFVTQGVAALALGYYLSGFQPGGRTCSIMFNVQLPTPNFQFSTLDVGR
jgi:hypothetical protein